ncbi:MAG: metallophosphoesterase family protein [Bacteroidota bacterium]
MSKQYYQKKKIKSPAKGRRFVIGDIHGCYQTFKKIVENKIQLSKNDQLFLLGDYIDKGPESKKTLNYILKLIKKGYAVYPLRGNHEQTLLDTEIEDDKKVLAWLMRQSSDMLKNGKLRKKHRDFLNSLPYYYELDNFFLVHANFQYEAKNPFEDKNAMLWRRKFDWNRKILKKKTLIHGHQPKNFKEIIQSINKKNKVIGLDNGVNYIKKHKIYDYTQMGNLCALNLDTFEIIFQYNCEYYPPK